VIDRAPAPSRLFARAARAVALLRLRPFDTSTEAGRAQERHRRIALSAAASLVAKILHSLALLVSVPLALSYLGKERYGLWTTMTTFIAMLAFSDMGLGSGMISVIAQAHGGDDRDRARRVVSSATFFLLLIAAIGTILFLLIYPLVPWPRVFNAQSALGIAESGPAMAICMLLFLVGLPLNVVQAVHIGYQEGFVPNVVQAGISLLSLAGIAVAIWLKLGLVGITALWLGASLLVRSINAAYLFGHQRPWLRPAWRWFDWPTASSLLKISFLYMVIGMSIAVGYTSDSMVLTQMIGPEAVTEYSVPYRLFSIVTVVMGFFLTPLWPAYAEAAARGDVSWVRITLRRSLLIGLAFNVLAALVLVLAGKWIIAIWVRQNVTPSTSLLIAFGLYLIVNCLHAPLSMLLNGLSVVRFQLFCWVAMALVNLGLSIVLTKWFGVPGVVFGTVIANFVCFVIPSFWYVRRHLAQLAPSPAIAQAKAADELPTV
jgi:O-antigen/teichoic acid export membrane protein